MIEESRVRGVLRLHLLLGIAVWLALALASFAPKVHLGIIEADEGRASGLELKSAQTPGRLGINSGCPTRREPG